MTKVEALQTSFYLGFSYTLHVPAAENRIWLSDVVPHKSWWQPDSVDNSYRCQRVAARKKMPDDWTQTNVMIVCLIALMIVLLIYCVLSIFVILINIILVMSDVD